MRKGFIGCIVGGESLGLVLRLLTLFFLLVESAEVSAQDFPRVEVETVSGKTIVLPDAFSGRYALVGVAAGRQAEDELRTWQIPVYNKFVAKTGMMDALFDVEVCFLPLFTGAMQAVKGKVVKKLEENNESLVIDHVLIYAGNPDPFASIGVDDKKQPHFFLLDPEGRIVYRAEGPFRQRYFDEIEDILTR